ncbi:hypothetical protein SBRCBS47491_005455 [Sporothrix bragantina]|uniref:Peptidase A1 domain-containing protein n=1 Tax=Sporothrix bragantina TaxID=671064 RepID=A0ABP0BWY2_9PEZI
MAASPQPLLSSRKHSSFFSSPISLVHLQLLLLALSSLTTADSNSGPPPPPPSAIGFVPSSNWAGIDGSWSTLQLSVGGGRISPAQNVSVLVSTLLSEIWVIENTGCVQSNLCVQQRGGVFNIDMAAANGNSSWQPLGPWSSGLNEAGLVPPNSDYGLATFHSYGYTAGASYRAGGTPASLTLGGYDASRIKVDNSNGTNNPATIFHLPSSSRDPELLLNSIGGIRPASNTSAAGTLWTKNIANDNQTTTLASVKGSASALAVIDTTTPFLWLEEDFCHDLSNSLGLVWNDTLKLYQFPSPEVYNDYYAGQGPSFNFYLSSRDNTTKDAATSVTVSSSAFALNATYPYAPSMKPSDPPVSYFPLQCLSVASGNDTTKRMILGRAFMQEVYMIMNYEAGHFTLYEAKFPDNSTGNNHEGRSYLVDIPPSPNSPFPVFKGHSGSGNDVVKKSGGLSTAATVGVVVGAFITGTAVALALWFCRRRRRQQKQAAAAAASGSGDGDGNGKDGTESMTETEPSTPGGSPMDRIFTFIGRGRWGSRHSANRSATDGTVPKSPTTTVDTERDFEKNAAEVAGSFSQPVEVGADSQHARYELPVPLPPVELDATAGGISTSGRNGSGRNHKIDDALVGGGVIDEFDDGHGYCDYDDGTVILGNDGVQHLTAYELARRRMQRQLRGPVPTYEPPTDPSILRQVANGNTARLEKSDEDVSPVAHCRAPPPLPLNAMVAARPAMSVSAVSSQSTNSNTVASLPTALSETTGSSNPNSTFAMLPSPLTPSSGGWPGRSGSGSGSGSGSQNSIDNVMYDLPSPMTIAAPFPSLFYQGDGHSSEEDNSGGEGSSSAPAVRHVRTAIDPTRVVCLGPLPEGVVVPVTVTTPVSPATPNIPPPTSDEAPLLRNQPSSLGSGSISSPSVTEMDSTLGTNYTLEEEARLLAMKQQAEQGKMEAAIQASAKEEKKKEEAVGTTEAAPAERIDAGFDLVHVPQLAERRYSWEGQEGEGEHSL